MKALSVLINEYATFEDLAKAILEDSTDEEMFPHGQVVYPNRTDAVKRVEKHYNLEGTCYPRVFYYRKTRFDWSNYYLLYEVLID